jgi:hypothetical protein
MGLQKSLGLSYKDAAHRLYMAEMETAKSSDSAARFFNRVRQQVDDLIIEDIGPAILAIDQGEFDNVTLKNGVWVSKDQSGESVVHRLFM